MRLRIFLPALLLVTTALQRQPGVGAGTVAKYGGMPPYAETQQYVANVLALNESYRAALAKQ